MHELLKKAITESKLSELEFFQTVYLARFNKVHNCVSELCEWKQNAVIPAWMRMHLLDPK